ncbi:MAG: putative HAD superfamily Cof-like phosphohydrolase [Rhodothermales bacterium]|jgi:predicted HAD superfamily Cof-like phosphohydrolase
MAFTTMVREFTRACHDELPATPTELSSDAVAFIREMVNDEMEELAEATTPVDQADALVDAIYYICDCAVRHGMNLDPLFAIVHQANMGKVVDGKVLRRDDGKILKPEGWQPPEPELEKEMARQTSDGGW